MAHLGQHEGKNVYFYITYFYTIVLRTTAYHASSAVLPQLGKLTS